MKYWLLILTFVLIGLGITMFSLPAIMTDLSSGYLVLFYTVGSILILLSIAIAYVMYKLIQKEFEVVEAQNKKHIASEKENAKKAKPFSYDEWSEKNKKDAEAILGEFQFGENTKNTKPKVELGNWDKKRTTAWNKIYDADSYRGHGGTRETAKENSKSLVDEENKIIYATDATISSIAYMAQEGWKIVSVENELVTIEPGETMVQFFNKKRKYTLYNFK